MSDDKQTLYMMIGVPLSGKTFLTRDIINKEFYNPAELPVPFTVISSDNIIEAVAKQCGLTYNEIFESMIKVTPALMAQQAEAAVRRGVSVIWDQTNLTVKSRAKKLKHFPPFLYRRIAMVSETPTPACLNARRIERGSDKCIPEDVVFKMITEYEPPKLEEGFEKIYHFVRGVAVACEA